MANKITRTIEKTDLIYGFLTNEGGVEQSGVISVNGRVEGEKAWKVLRNKVGVCAILIACKHRKTRYSMSVDNFVKNAIVVIDLDKEVTDYE